LNPQENEGGRVFFKVVRTGNPARGFNSKKEREGGQGASHILGRRRKKPRKGKGGGSGVFRDSCGSCGERKNPEESGKGEKYQMLPEKKKGINPYQREKMKKFLGRGKRMVLPPK